MTVKENPFSTYANLSCHSVGSKVLFATDDFFNVSETFFKSEPPVFDPDKFTEFGKEMDGWETRRKRSAGHDWCIIKLHEESEMGSACTKLPLGAAEAIRSDKWTEVVPYTPLAPGITTSTPTRTCKSAIHPLRVNYYPDGGVARFRTFGLVSKDWISVSAGQIVDLAHWPSCELLERASRTSPQSHRFRPLQNVGKDWAILELGHSGKVSEIKIDTHHFEGNFPESAINEGANIASSDSKLAETNSDKVRWFPLLSRVKLGPQDQSSWIGANPLMPIHFHVYKLLFGQEDLFTTFIRDLTFLSPLMDEDT
ncbi:galactose-binding domain-like protein [Powellomyces hirtus]|nr:galactose-binding domain-like protein [Powellomyces hirtus]